MSQDQDQDPNIDDDANAIAKKLKPKNSVDIAWEYAILTIPNNVDKWRCLKCGNDYSGGANRVKHHIANIRGNIVPCEKSSIEDKRRCKEALNEVKKKKTTKKIHNEDIRNEVNINDELDEIELVESGGSTKRSRTLGPMDRHVSQINPEFISDATFPKKTRQVNINDFMQKEKKHKVHLWLARWMYESGVAFNAIDNDSFIQFCEALGQYGAGYQPPSQYQLGGPLLKEEVERTKNSLKTHEEEWEAHGCSIMADACSDRKRRSIMNLCVNSRIGTAFLSSKEASGDPHTGEYIFKYVDECIETVGEKTWSKL